MTWYVVSVSKHDLGLALGAIGLGGGVVTATRPEREQVVITYVTGTPAPRVLAAV
jgi:hypothetical protein